MATQYQSKIGYQSVRPKSNIPLSAQLREAQGYRPQSSASSIGAANFKQVLGAGTSNTSSYTPSPSTGGQSTGGGGNTGGTINIGRVSQNSDDGQKDTNFLRQVYESARSGIKAQAPLIDQSYQQSQQDINNQVGIAEREAEGQRQDYGDQYGQILKNQVQTYQDLGRQRQGLFAGLGTLDSSAFGEQQFRADQALGEQTAQTAKEKQRAFQEVDNRLSQVKQQAQSQLAQLGIQYQQGKQQIAQALANNNIEEAQAIASALDNVKQRAQAIQQQAVDFANQIGMLKAQGYNVNVQEYGNSVNQQLAGLDRYATPKYTNMGSGYISTGKKDDKNPFLSTLIG